MDQLSECDGHWREDYEAWSRQRDSIRRMRALALSWETGMATSSKTEIGCAVKAVARLCAQDLRNFADELENAL